MFTVSALKGSGSGSPSLSQETGIITVKNDPLSHNTYMYLVATEHSQVKKNLYVSVV